jgi:hypothetical protein
MHDFANFSLFFFREIESVLADKYETTKILSHKLWTYWVIGTRQQIILASAYYRLH